MAVRFIAGPILLGILFAAMWCDGWTGTTWAWGALVLLGTGVSTYEVCAMGRKVGAQPWTGLAVAGGLLLVLHAVLSYSLPDSAFSTPAGDPGWFVLIDVRLLAIGWVMAVLLSWLARGRGPEDLTDIGLTLFAPAYVAGLGYFLVQIEGLEWSGIHPTPDANAAAARTDGPLALFWFLCSAKSADIFAFCGGKAYGRHKLAPSISPGKTWEGAITGLAGSILVGCALKPIAGGAGLLMSWPMTIAFAATCSIACQLGDLVESRLKRRAGVKDSGALLPEYGGFLDMVDGLIFAAPVGYAWLRLGI